MKRGIKIDKDGNLIFPKPDFKRLDKEFPKIQKEFRKYEEATGKALRVGSKTMWTQITI